MPNKKDQRIPLPNDVCYNFEDDHELLNFRPNIDFVSPEHQPDAPGNERFMEDDIGDQQDATANRILQLDAIVELADLAESRLDERISALGGLNIQLDARVDGPTIAAMKRMFPTNANSNQISYDQYKQALKAISAGAKKPPQLDPLDMRGAQENPFKTDFGAIGLAPGMARPEMAGGTQTIEPLSLPEFVAAAIMSLFAMLIPMITDLIKSVVGL